jgi:hypothetical protein
MKLKLPLFFILVCGAMHGGFEAELAQASPPHLVIVEELDQRAIHNLYNNSEFETVIDVLERFRKNNPQCSFSDSVFLAKHLAVVYAANSATREKGRFYMMQLLELVPSAKLVDMFVSEDIDRIFERAREEFFAKQHGFGLDSLTIRVPEHTDSSRRSLADNDFHSSRKPTWNRPKTWIIGGLAAATVGTAAYLYFYHPKRSEDVPELVIPKGNEK